MFIDKKKAKRHKWRISENTLILISILGGSIGSIMGMQLFRHKTKHVKFKLGLPIILIMQIILLCIF
ncbi:membrane protein [Clostridium baratii]|nr:membrane protein [Clostridium baratii]